MGLFLYAKLNPGQSYVQGMNEIIGPIYYVLAADSDLEWRQHAEADCFFCFTNLMSDIRDFFIKTLDDSSTGIQALMIKLNNRIEQVDQAVADQLQQQGIRMQYFAFRWLSLMLSQEFSLPDVLTLWDALLTDDSRTKLLINVCTSMLCLVRDSLLQNDFASNMKMLQGWTEERKQQYFLWSAKVVLGLRGSNQIIEDKIDDVLTRNGIENPKEVKLEESEKKE